MSHSQAQAATRLKHAEGHLRRVVGMNGEGRPRLDLATQRGAVERAVAAARRALDQDQIDHCDTTGGDRDLADIKALTQRL